MLTFRCLPHENKWRHNANPMQICIPLSSAMKFVHLLQPTIITSWLSKTIWTSPCVLLQEYTNYKRTLCRKHDGGSQSEWSTASYFRWQSRSYPKDPSRGSPVTSLQISAWTNTPTCTHCVHLNTCIAQDKTCWVLAEGCVCTCTLHILNFRQTWGPFDLLQGQGF